MPGQLPVVSLDPDHIIIESSSMSMSKVVFGKTA